MQQVPITVFSGPTVLIEYGGLRLLTDPTFDGPGDYELPGGLVLTKTAPSPITPKELGPVDAVLLSHDQHADNLDTSGRNFLAGVPLTLTTTDGAQRLGGTTRALSPWASVELPRPDGGMVTVTGTPALHGPEGAEAIAGEVIGFVLTSDDLPTIYVSGDNASLDVVRQIAERFGPIDSAVLFAGAPRLPVFDGALVVLDGAGAATAAQILEARRVVPAHCDSWAHFTEDRGDLVNAFTSAGIANRLQLD
ncbi:MBL fold metallo-hydrolase [Streptomyces sp. NPDC088354]|uniref:MBL fold metallo-hydrolase n=1 Tax=unclassified Streptomyces TaxID=2593676 RepID=UPI0029B0D018|nr:MBL fold metallo-hydrolase [Streptomyces sp. MI02-7b]MDX3078605.1 MBL fold metallo-hydrolase [Streptomyces sp. MI02-7b]